MIKNDCVYPLLTCSVLLLFLSSVILLQSIKNIKNQAEIHVLINQYRVESALRYSADIFSSKEECENERQFYRGINKCFKLGKTDFELEQEND